MRKSLLIASIALSSAASQIPLQVPIEVSEYSKKPLIDTKALQDSIKAKNLLARSEKLYEIAKKSEDEFNHPTRVIGSKGHWGTIGYILETVGKLGDYYKISTQAFPAIIGRINEFRITIGDKVPKSERAFALSPPTPRKEAVFGALVQVKNDGCDAADFSKAVTDNIAFIRRGTCPFSDKSALAGKAGALAVIMYNNEKGPFGGTLGLPLPEHVATVGISLEDAEPYLKQLANGDEVEASVYVDAYVQAMNTTNVIAQTRDGDEFGDGCVMLGGHSDSVDEGPGINDDGSGTISLLEIATQLTNFTVKNCVRFAWWAGEEEGLLGSDWYVAQLSDAENQRIRLFMDYDMMASPNFAYQIYNATNARNPEGSEELRDLYIEWYKDQGLNYTFIPFDGRSDYDAFIRNGIPGGGIATGAEGIKTKDEEAQFGGKAGDWFDPCYHQLCDDLSNLNMTAFEVNTKLIAHSVATFARSFDKFPKRKSVKSFKAQNQQQQFKYHGSKLVL